jgi:hypothetical protein
MENFRSILKYDWTNELSNSPVKQSCVSLTQDVTMEKSEEKMTSSLKKLFGNPATITFLVMNLFLGMGWGAADAYLTIYLNEELNASYELIGQYVIVARIQYDFLENESKFN